MDFVKQLRPELNSDQLVRVGQIVTIVLVVLASLWAPQIEKFGSLWEYFQQVLAYITPPVVAVFIVGLFWKRANATGGLVSLLAGCLVSVFIIIVITFSEDLFNSLANVHFLHNTFYLFIFCILVNVVVSFAPPSPEDKVRDYTWNNAILATETKELKQVVWYKNYRILSVALLIITALVVSISM